jgi:hypothetical protein
MNGDFGIFCCAFWTKTHTIAGSVVAKARLRDVL